SMAAVDKVALLPKRYAVKVKSVVVEEADQGAAEEEDAVERKDEIVPAEELAPEEVSSEEVSSEEVSSEEVSSEEVSSEEVSSEEERLSAPEKDELITPLTNDE